MNRLRSRAASHLLVVSFCLPLLAGLMGCGKKDAAKAEAPGQPKEVSRAVAAEAENYMSDAMFAVQLKDFARAEQSIAKAVKLREDVPDWWLNLGVARKKLGKLSDAKTAYRRALALHERAYAATKDPQFIEGQIYILVLLDEEKAARALLEKGIKAHPENAHLKTFRDAKGIDQLLHDPNVIDSKL